jgi:hypothetical protein
MFAQYCRIESRAGGVSASPRAMIRSARKCLSKSGKSRESREMRHMLAMHHEALLEYMSVMSGRKIKRRKTDEA